MMGFNQPAAGGKANAEQFMMSDELLAALRQRVEARYYDQPQIIELIARAILISRGIYPQ